MNQPLSSFANQRGFTLMESLIALVLFAIIILGSGTAIKSMLTTQKEMNVGFIVLNEMQKRLQEAQDKAATSGMCARISTTEYEINTENTYYFGCSTEKIVIPGDNPPTTSKEIEWPILAASDDSETTAKNCAAGVLDESCFIVGR